MKLNIKICEKCACQNWWKFCDNSGHIPNLYFENGKPIPRFCFGYNTKEKAKKECKYWMEQVINKGY